jgi:dolichol-phosphate mannosyltransferase
MGTARGDATRSGTFAARASADPTDAGGTSVAVQVRSGGMVVRSHPELSIVLATLNERQNLPELLERIRGQRLPSYEIIVIDDGSTDGTREFLSAAAAGDSRIRLLFHEGKQTTLRAQCQGIEEALGTFVVVMDADLQHPPELFGPMLKQLDGGAAVVIASRYAPGGSAGPRTAFRWSVSRGAEWLAKLLLAPARHIRDPVSGFFAFRREIWAPLDPLYRGYKLLVFVLVMAEGRRVAEVGYQFTPRTEGSSKVTQGFAFVRIFVIELLLARRLRVTLRGRDSRAYPVSASDPEPKAA